MIYVVLGMHKSGTTLISQILHKSGVVMGSFDEAVDYDSGNQYERKETLEINMEMLNKGYSDYSLEVIDPIETIDSAVKARVNKLINDLDNRHEEWGFKDPRTCLTYNIWKQLLPGHKLIVVYRAPVEIWYHYTKNIHWWRLDKLLKRGLKALKAWCVYNRQIIKIIKASPYESVVFNYRDFMNDTGSFELLEKFVGIKLVDAREKKLYRARGKNTALFKLAKRICLLRYSMDVVSVYADLSRFNEVRRYSK